MLDLAVVMPVYNEQECIVDVVNSWREALSGLQIDYKIIVLNDGSRDGTREALTAFDGDPRIGITHKTNSGHGPTILVGYREAVNLAEWVFQCDSDDEMKAANFNLLWEKRDDYDALFGVRIGRQQNLGRRLISGVSRATVQLYFGAGVTDVNVPYRLIRARILKEIIASIPDDTFAPNVIISGALARAKLRIHNEPIPHEGRKTGTISIVKWKLWRAAIRSFGQTLRHRARSASTDRSVADKKSPRAESR